MIAVSRFRLHGAFPNPKDQFTVADEHRALLEPVFRQAETEFRFFIEKLTELFSEVDSQIPPLPPKDLIYRIYRDVHPLLLLECCSALRLYRFDSAMTRRRTKQTSPRPFQGVEERVSLLVVRPHMHQYAHYSYPHPLIQITCTPILRRTLCYAGFAEPTYLILQNE